MFGFWQGTFFLTCTKLLQSHPPCLGVYLGCWKLVSKNSAQKKEPAATASPLGLRENAQEGKLVPVEIVVKLLQQAMEKLGWAQEPRVARTSLGAGGKDGRGEERGGREGVAMLCFIHFGKIVGSGREAGGYWVVFFFA